MSLRGRQFIDGLKARVGKWLKLPCPPYSQTKYWKGVYESLGPHDVYEWGSVTLNDNLVEYDYQLLDPSGAATARSSRIEKSTFSEAISVDPSDADKPILLLGCGNSKLGEDMAQHGWKGPLIQVDVVASLLDMMAVRCAPLVQDKTMEFIEDDATMLSAFEDGKINAVVDKGLVDALFCADDYQQVKSIVHSVHRVLKPRGIFCFFSLSRPEFLMPKLCVDLSRGGKWKDIQVRQLESILMYRFQKNDEQKRPRNVPTKKSLQRKRRKRSASKGKEQPKSSAR